MNDDVISSLWVLSRPYRDLLIKGAVHPHLESGPRSGWVAQGGANGRLALKLKPISAQALSAALLRPILAVEIV
ncbi:MAG: hypothetical protein ACKO28_03045 [Cyanobium sp.]